MPTLALDCIDDHPDNANVMAEDALDALANHIKRTGRYPPLIVRPHPDHADRFQLLDGHHRAMALRRLDHTEAQCDVWDVDNAAADELLLTLNRLRGEDDPTRRARLLQRMRDRLDLSEMARRLPEDARRIERLIATLSPPPKPAAPPALDGMPQPLTFFVTSGQRRAVLARLASIDADRTTALLRQLNIEDAGA